MKNNITSVSFLYSISSNGSESCFDPNDCFNFSPASMISMMTISNWNYSKPAAKYVIMLLFVLNIVCSIKVSTQLTTSVGALEVGTSKYANDNPKQVTLSPIIVLLSKSASIPERNGTILYPDIGASWTIDSYSPVAVTFAFILPHVNNTDSVTLPFAVDVATTAPINKVRITMPYHPKHQQLYIILAVCGGVLCICILGIIIVVFYKKFPHLRMKNEDKNDIETLSTSTNRKHSSMEVKLLDNVDLDSSSSYDVNSLHDNASVNKATVQ